MARKPKAHPLPKSTRVRIGRKKARHPNLTYGELAAQFNCTYDQARSSHHAYRDGQLSGTRTRRDKGIEVEGSSLLATFQTAMDKLNSDKNLSGAEMVVMLERLARARHTIQQMDLTGHLRSTDAALIARIIRRYEPDASDDEVIAVYREEVELWKASV